MQWLSRSWRRVFDERPGDPLPMQAIVVAIAGSVVATIAGALLGGMGFLINILAAIALLGPSLVITNILARNWKLNRDRAELWRRIGPPLGKVVLIVRASLQSWTRNLPDAAPIKRIYSSMDYHAPEWRKDDPYPLHVEDRIMDVEPPANYMGSEAFDGLISDVRGLKSQCEAHPGVMEEFMKPDYPFAFEHGSIAQIRSVLESADPVIGFHELNVQLSLLHNSITTIQEDDSSMLAISRFFDCLLGSLLFIMGELPK